MLIIVSKTKLDGVLKIKEEQVFYDERGYYREIYNEKIWKEAGLPHFVQEDISYSRKNVFRGIHGDNITGKLVKCLYGSFYLVVVNNDPISSQYRLWESFVLNGFDGVQIYIPPKFGNGHLALTDEVIFHYCQTQYYKGEKNQFTIYYNDPTYKIWIPVREPIVSKRDNPGGK